MYNNFESIRHWGRHHEQSPLIKQLLRIRDEIVLRTGSNSNAMDCLDQWFERDKGMSRAYDFFVHKVGKWPWKPVIWKSCIHLKHQFALWLFAHGKLQTRDRLTFIEDKVCVLCKEETESVDHIFFRCKISKSIWQGVRDWLQMKKCMGSSTTVLKAFRGTPSLLSYGYCSCSLCVPYLECKKHSII